MVVSERDILYSSSKVFGQREVSLISTLRMESREQEERQPEQDGRFCVGLGERNEDQNQSLDSRSTGQLRGRAGWSWMT